MKNHEYDVLEIPEEYKKMSVPELEAEAERVLKEWRAVERPKKKITPNKLGIVFEFHKN